MAALGVGFHQFWLQEDLSGSCFVGATIAALLGTQSPQHSGALVQRVPHVNRGGFSLQNEWEHCMNRENKSGLFCSCSLLICFQAFLVQSAAMRCWTRWRALKCLAHQTARRSRGMGWRCCHMHTDSLAGSAGQHGSAEHAGSKWAGKDQLTWWMALVD